MSPCPADVSPLLHMLTAAWNRGGWVGVDLFFVLSGFLVSGLLFQEHIRFGRISAKAFLIRRAFKIYPAFWLLILVTVLVELFRDHSRSASSVLAELFFFQNYRVGLWSHTWSLAVEEHFYLFLALLLLGLSLRPMGNKKFRSIPMCFAFLGTACLTFRLLTLSSGTYNHYTQLYPSHLRVDSLFFGVLLSYYYHHHREAFLAFAIRYKLLLLTTGVFLLVPAFIWQLETTPFVYTAGLSVFYLGSGCLMTALLPVRIRDRGVPAVAAYVGSHSYSLYLWHLPLALWGLPVLARMLIGHWNWYLYVALYLLGSLAVGIVMSKLVEVPMLRVRDRWIPSRGHPLSSGLDRRTLTGVAPS